MSELLPAVETYEWRCEEAVSDARAKGFEVICAAPDRLLIDIDDTESKKHFQRSLGLLRGHFGLVEMERWRSKSGDGWHIVLRCNPCDFTTRIALQACLGSDRKREALALMMAKDGEPDPSYLFKPPNARKVSC
jgi:hypothetical protein